MADEKNLNQRLRKQPKIRRMQTAVHMPRLNVPYTAKQRRRRNQRSWLQRPALILRQLIFTARWVSLGLLAMSVGALALIGLDENFYLTFIPVEGAASIPPAEIVEISGLAGTHIFAANPYEAASHIDALPGVISATVMLNWPNQVSIHIKEDSPIAIWQDNGQEYWINRSGSLLPARSSTQGLLHIESEIPPGAEGATAVASQTIITTSLKTALPFIPQDVLVGALQLRELRPNIERLYYRPSGGLSYQDGRGWRAYFGTGSDMQQKLVVYETIVDELINQGLTPVYISVSNQEKPYYLAQ